MTVDDELGALRAVYRLAMRQGRPSRIPHIPLFGKSADVPRTGFVERVTLDKIAEALRVAGRSGLADAATFAYLSAWRRGEILPLPLDASGPEGWRGPASNQQTRSSTDTAP